ncbi:hypothetical protein CPC08DRAFT_373207 [Agrocybe pediades]|nr:hypothetical protein CPC08DRAFT_373207 [Agrocybe pediades]
MISTRHLQRPHSTNFQFINLLSGSDFRVGDHLESCTKEVQVSDPFEIDGRVISLIDTPGFDDTSISDTTVLNMIATYLSYSHANGKHLAGVIYMHRILDNRVGGISTRNFRLFRKICGESTLDSVVIATTMWDQVDQAVGERREDELSTKDHFFKPAVEKGARLLRHHNNVESARNIISSIVQRNKKPVTLQIQDELSRGLDISETKAGVELRQEIFEQMERYREEIRGIMLDIHEASRHRDEESRQELALERERIERLLLRLQDDSASISEGYRDALGRLEERLRVAEANNNTNTNTTSAQKTNGTDPRHGDPGTYASAAVPSMGANEHEMQTPTVQAVAATENSNAILEGKLAAAIPIVGFWGRISVMLAPFSLTWR